MYSSAKSGGYHGVGADWLLRLMGGAGLLDSNQNISAGAGMSWLADDWGQSESACGGWCAQKVDSFGAAIVVPLMCGKWSCPACGGLREWWFKRNVDAWHGAYSFVGFWTLTIQRDGLTALESWEVAKAAWAKLLRRMKRAGYGCEFVWVAEPQKAGYCHLHVLVDLYIPWDWVQANWNEVTGGAKVVRVDPVAGAAPSGYLAKYMGKVKNVDSLVPGYESLKGKRMFSTSRGIRFDGFRKSTGGWEVVYHAFKEYFKFALINGDIIGANVRGAPSFEVRALPGGPLKGRGDVPVPADLNIFSDAMDRRARRPVDRLRPPAFIRPHPPFQEEGQAERSG